jgi:FlaA1/EpsC-like NDP-sugar epimerase
MLKRKWSFILRHYDFLIVDLVAFLLGFLVALYFRQSLHLTLRNQKYFLLYGITAVVSYALVGILSENINGILTRGVVREVKAVITQMTLTWCVYLTLLFLMHNIRYISRIFVVISYLICIVFVLVFRTIWRQVCKNTRLRQSVLPRMLLVCDADKAQTVLNRLLAGMFSNEYEICGIVTTEGKLIYSDYYPVVTGLGNVQKFMGDHRLQEAYVELADATEEKTVLEQLLNSGIIVHRSLGDSKLQYARQYINQINEISVLTITENDEALVSKADRIWRQFRRKMSRKEE